VAFGYHANHWFTGDTLINHTPTQVGFPYLLCKEDAFSVSKSSPPQILCVYQDPEAQNAGGQPPVDPRTSREHPKEWHPQRAPLRLSGNPFPATQGLGGFMTGIIRSEF